MLSLANCEYILIKISTDIYPGSNRLFNKAITNKINTLKSIENLHTLLEKL